MANKKATAKVLEAAREYAIASDRYHTACLTIAMERGKQNVPAEEWDDTTRAACRAVNAAQSKLNDACEELFPQTNRAEAWKQYSAAFYGPAPKVAP